MLNRERVGWELPVLEVTVDRWRLWQFALAIGETNPIYLDDAAARAAGYRSVPAPPTFLFCLSYDVPDQAAYLRELGADIRGILHGEQSFRYHRPVCAGDRVVIHSRIADMYEKKGGQLEFIVRECSVFDPQQVLMAELHEILVMRHAAQVAPA